jgi:hypothetical protein
VRNEESVRYGIAEKERQKNRLPGKTIRRVGCFPLRPLFMIRREIGAFEIA